MLKKATSPGEKAWYADGLVFGWGAGVVCSAVLGGWLGVRGFIFAGLIGVLVALWLHR